ncbi:MAG: hypothetical protein K9W43_03300 [Candidatus Thorarchaeota archaeon]|nr:hypothetical protein [Candidatus Thorarchaeota archaeon]
MISDAKTQNIIIVSMIIVSVISGISLYTSASYYGGSYVMVTYLDVNLESVRISNFDPTNHSLNPRLTLDFRFEAPMTLNGDATLSFLLATVFLNNESITYSAFRLNVPSEKRALHPGYNESFILSSEINDNLDKAIFFNASESGQWIFSIRLIISYHVFKSTVDSHRIMLFAQEGAVFE